MKYKVFVDGQEGTTGLKINERLAGREEIELLKIPEEKRKDMEERRKYINAADIVFLCLPDAAAKEAVSLVENDTTRIIDASTAHRTNPDWVYGIPELSKETRAAIRVSKRVAVPGCYATGFNCIVHPLVSAGIMGKEYPVACHAVSGYSGGGKKLIAMYEDPAEAERVASPALYAFELTHKHVPEMRKISGLDNKPIFTPIVCNYYEGMTVSIPIHRNLLTKKLSVEEIQKFFAEYYEGSNFIHVMPYALEEHLDGGMLREEGCNGTNNLELYISGNEEQILIVARLDNLGKGASGAAVQNMNIMLGLDETTGLI